MNERSRPSGIVHLDKDAQREFNPLSRWKYPAELFVKTLSQVPNLETEGVHENISWGMDTYWRERGSKNSLMTLEILGAVLKIMSNSFPALNQPGEVKLGKQQPSLVESTAATVKRLRFLQRYVDDLTSPCISLISGGSMSYGRFYNVREGDDPSDLDLIIVFEDDEIGKLNSETITPTNLGFDSEDAKVLDERIKIFQGLAHEKKANILSHKANVKPLGFATSMHIMSSSTFESLMVLDPNTDLKSGKNVERRVNDYKPEPFKHTKVRLHNFSGEPFYVPVDEEPVKNGTSESEVITSIPAHAVIDGEFVPGLYHNLLSPRFEMEAFSARECVAAATLFWSLMKRLEKQYKKDKPEASALKSHIRYEIFNRNLKS